MEIKRDIYLNRLIDRRESGSVKVITGIRHCGKSYLLFNLFYKYLIGEGIPKDHIIRIALDDEEHEELLDSKVLGAYILSAFSNMYLLITEAYRKPGPIILLMGACR